MFELYLQRKCSHNQEHSPGRFGSTLFSVGDLYNKIKSFRQGIIDSKQPLYFCKLDVQSAFDTIPQAAVVKLISELPDSEEYNISKHVEVKPGDGHQLDIPGQTRSKPTRKWISLAATDTDFEPFDLKVQNKMAVNRKNTVFVGNVAMQYHTKHGLLTLLAEHVQRNLVKIGKKFYRQRNGIPQGSVLSSLLCNYFYADLEARHLSFLKPESSLLLRLIDDFLLITTDSQHAKRFLQIMHDGLPEYGVSVGPDKTLVNFEISINGRKLARLLKSHEFPYCGTFINTHTLNLTKDRERNKDVAMADSLTVEFSRTPGKTFHRKILNTFKIQCHAMFLDTAFNSPTTVARNIYENFMESATKMYTYNKCLPIHKQAGTKIIIQIIESLVDLAFVLIKSKEKNPRNASYRCAISKAELEWLAFHAFTNVLKPRQSKYKEVLHWLEGRLEGLMMKKGKMVTKMSPLVGPRS